MEKVSRKCTSKANPRTLFITKLVQEPFLILVNFLKQPMHASNTFEKKRYFERRLSKKL